MALSDQQFNQFLLDAQDSTGFGINRYNELKELGATNQQIAEIAANAPVVGPKAKESLPELKDIYYTRIRNELETQYNNVVEAGKVQGKDLSYRGSSSDLPTVWNQQARQLADGGVSSISNLRNQDGRLVDISTGQPFTNTNLGGAVAIDRDTGAQKFGDIFSGVKGGANYGIQFAPDGSPILFPVWEKTKSPIAQIGLGGLEDVIGPVLTIAGAYYGIPGLGEVGGAAAGAAAGNSVGQYLASGDIDWGQVALSAAVAGGTQAALGGAEVAGAPTPDGGIVGTPGVSTVYPVASPNIGVATLPPQAAAGGGLLAAQAGAPISTATPVPANELAFPAREVAYTPNASLDPNSFQAALPGMGVETAATTAPFTAAPGSLAAAGGLTGAAALAAEGGGLLGAAGVGDALQMAAVGNALFGKQPQMGGLLGGQRGGGQPMGVDYSGLLSLLQARTGTPNVASLLAPAVNRYQPLTTQQSLLG
jgi:hypothetical protein